MSRSEVLELCVYGVRFRHGALVPGKVFSVNEESVSCVDNIALYFVAYGADGQCSAG